MNISPVLASSEDPTKCRKILHLVKISPLGLTYEGLLELVG